MTAPPLAHPPSPTGLARTGLARIGGSLATAPLLELRLAHARARDAVHAVLDVAALAAALPPPVLAIASQAPNRQAYLMRPDLGRTLPPEALATLAPHQAAYDLAIVIGDGLSAQAAQRHAAPLIDLLPPSLPASPIVIVQLARVKIGDAVAQALGAAAVLVLIGERPGLSAPESLGAYLTWAPHAATTDADRNCISNIRPEGLPYAEAARRIIHLLARMRTLRVSGVALKDDSSALA